MKTKIKFSDIAGMLERDEMKEIVGGSGNGSEANKPCFLPGTALGGGGASGSSGGANFNYSGGLTGGGLTSNYGSSSYNTGYSYTTTNPNEIGALLDMLKGKLSNTTQQGTPPTDCVFQSVAYLAGLYGDSSLNINSMQNTYNSLYSGAISAGIIKPASGGVDGYLLPSFSDQYFNRVGGITTIAQLSNFIAAGGSNFALASYGTGNGTGHEFVITGVTSTQYIGWDAQNQIPVSINKNLITGFVAISGICH
jgi:hypothetical protein